MLDPISIAGMATSLAGGVASLFGASAAKKRANEQIGKVAAFNQGQQNNWDTKMAEMMAAQKAIPTYQSDMSGYQALSDKARLNEIQASGQTRVAGQQFALDQADQSYANLVQATGKLGGSRADMATSLLMGQQNVSAQKGQTLAQGQQMMFQDQQQARMNSLNTLGQVAAARVMEGYKEYGSQAANRQGVIGLMGQDLQGRTALAQQGFQSQMMAQNIAGQAADQLYMGGANILGTIGSGLNAIGMQNMKMSSFSKMMGGNSGNPWEKVQGAQMAGV